MEDADDLATALSAIKRAGELTKSLTQATSIEEVRNHAFDLQRQILSGQELLLAAIQHQAERLDRTHKLEERLAQGGEWTATKSRYRLKNVGLGAFIYAPEPGGNTGEPEHWLCARCFDNRQRSVLQYKGRAPYKQEHLYGCPNCNSTIRAPFASPGEQG